MKKSRNSYRIILGVFIFISILIMAPAGIGADSDSIQILHIDEYSKAVVAGESTTYNWTIRNIASGVNLTVEISVNAPAKNWKHSLVTQEIDLNASGLGSVVAIVEAPYLKGASEDVLNMTLKVFEDSTLVQVAHMTAFTTIHGALASSEKILGLFENPLPSPLNNEWGVFILDIVIWLILAISIAFALDGIGRLFSRKSALMLEKIIMGILRTPLLVLIFLYGAVKSLDALHMHIPESMRQTISSVYQLILVIMLFYVAYKLFKNVLVYYGKVISKRTASKVDDILVPVLEKVGISVIGLGALIYALAALNVDLTAFIAGGMFLSFVIAFAAQETISNFFSGIFILLDRPFKVGDIVILSDGDWCEVRKIGLRTTKLFRYSDASLVAMPNNTLVNEKIANFTSVPDKGRVMMTFGVSYNSDVEKVRTIIREVINDCEYIIKDDPNSKPIVRFEEMADSSLNFFVLVWLHERAERFNTKDFLNTNIFRRFNEEGIEVPFPQRVVHLRKDED